MEHAEKNMPMHADGECRRLMMEGMPTLDDEGHDDADGDVCMTETCDLLFERRRATVGRSLRWRLV